MNYKLLLLTIISVSWSAILGQTFDSFDDGNFTENPTWQGDTALFKINSNNQLQLNANEAGKAFLLLPSQTHLGILEWRFYVKLALSPSDNNFARIFLLTNTLDLHSSDLVGYYLQLGENLSNDAIELFYQNHEERTSICRGTDGYIAAPFAIELQILLYEDGTWLINEKNISTGIYTPHAIGNHIPNFNICSPIVGFFTQFTSGSRTKFYLDDVYIGPEIIDTIPPRLLNWHITEDGHSLNLQFTESINPLSGLEIENFTLLPSHHIDSIFYTDNNLSNLTLLFKEPLEDRSYYKLNISNLDDLYENRIIDTSINIIWYQIRRHDLLITEIMADPTPQVALPNTEYIEIYNYGIPDTITLEGWKICLGNVSRQIPTSKIAPQGHLLLIPRKDTFPNFDISNIVEINSLSISNDGQQIVLLNSKNEPIHYIHFKKEWHTHPLKIDGGWSLEMIDTENPCGEAENWGSSIDPRGGTPGYNNSITQHNPDNTSPHLLKVTLQNNRTINAYFSESILSNFTPEYFHINHNISIDSVKYKSPDNKSVTIFLHQELEPQKIYTLEVAYMVEDCRGNKGAQYETIQFGIPEKPQKEDVIINEILFNAIGNSQAHYIELYNKSEKIIDLQDIFIGYGKEEAEYWIKASEEGELLLPKMHKALCKERQSTYEQYISSVWENLIEVSKLPNFNNTNGIIYLSDIQGNIIDKFSYHEDMHYALLNNYDGIALERINYNQATQNRNNWKSAAESVGFGTPGKQNSQYQKGKTEEKILTTSLDVFSPNNDGYEDVVEIFCHFEESENRISLNIYDKNGNLIINLANNLIAQQEEYFTWDGTDHKKQQVPIGIYLIELEYWNLKGKKGRKRTSIGVLYR